MPGLRDYPHQASCGSARLSITCTCLCRIRMARASGLGTLKTDEKQPPSTAFQHTANGRAPQVECRRRLATSTAEHANGLGRDRKPLTVYFQKLGGTGKRPVMPLQPRHASCPCGPRVCKAAIRFWRISRQDLARKGEYLGERPSGACGRVPPRSSTATVLWAPRRPALIRESAIQRRIQRLGKAGKIRP